MTKSVAREHFRWFKGLEVVVLGDVMLDEYVYGDADRLSPEAPVPAIREQRRTYMLGGAGNVARNIVSLGATARLVGVVGDDGDGNRVYDLAQGFSEMVTDPSRTTTKKTRIVANHQHVCRIDKETTHPISGDIQDQVIARVRYRQAHALIVSDYGKGLFGGELFYKLSEPGTPSMFIDPKGTTWRRFPYAQLIAPNKSEAEKMTGLRLLDDLDYEEAAGILFQKHRSHMVMIKRGAEGISSFESGEPPIHVRSTAQQVFDVSGAGDTVIAMTTLALLAGASLEEATTLANIAAGVVVSKIGTVAVTQEEVLDALED